tara:strand:+ start:334 stop:501 length:168 start_codon:yes stop_codon:yes gene_type:complete
MAGPVRVVRDILSEPGGFKSLRIRYFNKDGKLIKESIGDLSKKDKKSKGLKIKDV